MDEFAPIAYSNFANILQTARGSNTAFLFAMQSIPQLLSVGKAFQHDVASAPNTTFMLRTRDEDTAQYFLNASARVRQLRRSMSIRKKGIFKPSYEDQGIGSQTEIKETRSQEEHIKNLPVGQMEYLMSDKRFGTIHRWTAFPPSFPRSCRAMHRSTTRRSGPTFAFGMSHWKPVAGEVCVAAVDRDLTYENSNFSHDLGCPISSLNEAQTARRSRQQSANSDQAKLEPQRRYDPLAGQKHLQDGPLDKFLDSINPNDRDFGALIADARERLVEQTAENSYFWIILGQSLMILLLVSYIFWLFRQRNDRLEISVNIVTQLANSYLYTRSRAIDAIRRHNRLVDDYNALAEKQSRRRDAATASLTAAVSDSSENPTIEIPLETVAPLPLVEAGASPKPNPADRGSTPDITADGEFMTKKQIKALMEETKRTSTLGAKHQISALNQQVQNLREQFNQALTQVQHCEKRHRRSVGA